MRSKAIPIIKKEPQSPINALQKEITSGVKADPNPVAARKYPMFFSRSSFKEYSKSKQFSAIMLHPQLMLNTEMLMH